MLNMIKRKVTEFLKLKETPFFRICYNSELDIFEVDTKDRKHITIDHYSKSIDETMLNINIYRSKNKRLFRKNKYYGNESVYTYQYLLPFSEYTLYKENKFKLSTLENLVYKAISSNVTTYSSFTVIEYIKSNFKKFHSTQYLFDDTIPFPSFSVVGNYLHIEGTIETYSESFWLIDGDIYKIFSDLTTDFLPFSKYKHSEEQITNMLVAKSVTNNHYYWHYLYNGCEIDIHYKDSLLVVKEYNKDKLNEMIFDEEKDISKYFEAFYKKALMSNIIEKRI